jgi:alcohol dehydrogenase (cytochrome c)
VNPLTPSGLLRQIGAILALSLIIAATACEREREREPDSDRQVAGAPPQPAFPSVSDSLLASGAGRDWPAPAGNLENHSYSPLDQINTGNVHELVPVWIHSTGIEGALETSPIVVGNTLYATTAGGRVIALNAATGAELWTFDPEPETVTLCCGPINRGVSVWGNYVYVSTLDARLIALDARSGQPRWEMELADPEAGYSAVMAPLAIDGRVYAGVAGQWYGIRGFLAAFDARTGEELWRWHTVPSPEEGGWTGSFATMDPFGTRLNRDTEAEREGVAGRPENWRMGGGGITTTPAYDRATGRIFVNVEGPSPVIDGGMRPGDNLYTGSIVAIDARTGEKVWHAQYLPHDSWGLAGGSPPFLFDRGGERHVAFAGRTGWVYVFRAADGAPVLRSDNFVPQEGLFTRPTPEDPVRVAPGTNGGNSGAPVAYHPNNGVVFVGGVHQPMVYSLAGQGYSRGQLWLGGDVRFTPDDEQWGTITAIDLADGQITWQRRTPAPVHSGVLVTAGNLVLVGQGSGSIDALNSANGELLWQFNTGAGVHGSPVTYSVGGVQYVVVPAGGSHHFGTATGDDIIAFALASRRPARTVESYPATTYQRRGPAEPVPPEVRQEAQEAPSPVPPGPDTAGVDSPRARR